MYTCIKVHTNHILLNWWLPLTSYIKCIMFMAHCCCSVTQLFPTLCNSMDCSTPGFPVHHQLPELAQTRPLSRWCHPVISSSIVPFSSCLQSCPASGSFPRSQFFASGGQSIGASASVFPMNIQDWFPLGLTVWSPCSPWNSKDSSPAPEFKSINSLVLRLLYDPTLLLCSLGEELWQM